MAIFSKLWFWFLMLVIFLTIILYDKDLDKDVQSSYVKQKMRLADVHFSEMDQGFEQARIFADVVDMDDNQSNLVATNVRALFFDKLVATRSGELTSHSATKNPQEIVFFGDVKIHTTDRERLRSEELRYLTSRKEMYTPFPVTLWKDDTIITGRDLRYNMQTKEAALSRNVVIRIWNPASLTAKISSSSAPLASASEFEKIAPAALKGAVFPIMEHVIISVATNPREPIVPMIKRKVNEKTASEPLNAGK